MSKQSSKYNQQGAECYTESTFTCVEADHTHTCLHTHGMFLEYTKDMGILVPLGPRSPGLGRERNLDEFKKKKKN